jgi:hypothetical protein
MNGWKLVPVEATREMMNACAEIHQWHDGGKTWAAMLAASPAPVVTEEMVERAARAINPRAFWTAEEWIKKLPPPINASRTPDEIVAGHAGERDKVRATARAALAAALEVKGEPG